MTKNETSPAIIISPRFEALSFGEGIITLNPTVIVELIDIASSELIMGQLGELPIIIDIQGIRFSLQLVLCGSSSLLHIERLQ